MKIYCYSGDLKKLKSLGYEFKKLYAKNHKCYTKDRLYMFVIDNMIIEYSSLLDEQQFFAINFILKNKNKKDDFWHNPKERLSTFCLTKNGSILTYEDFFDKRIKEFYPKLEELAYKRNSGKYSSVELKKMSEELYSLDISRDAFALSLDFVSLVKELDNLHPLKIIEIEDE